MRESGRNREFILECGYKGEINLIIYLLGSEHVLWLDPLSELLFGEDSQFDGLLDERRSVLMGGLGDLGGVVVADVWVEGGDEHQGLSHDLQELSVV